MRFCSKAALWTIIVTANQDPPAAEIMEQPWRVRSLARRKRMLCVS